MKHEEMMKRLNEVATALESEANELRSLVSDVLGDELGEMGGPPTPSPFGVGDWVVLEVKGGGQDCAYHVVDVAFSFSKGIWQWRSGAHNPWLSCAGWRVVARDV